MDFRMRLNRMKMMMKKRRKKMMVSALHFSIRFSVWTHYTFWYVSKLPMKMVLITDQNSLELVFFRKNY